MKIFSRKQKKEKKRILVISDLHLGAGEYFDGRKNPLEDFHAEKKIVEFLDFYSTGAQLSFEIELIINGDFFDLLAVPFVPYFDDEYWSEKSSLEKLRICIAAHHETISALNRFLKQKNRKITYIIGNHDAELIFSSLQDEFKMSFDEDVRALLSFHDDGTPYKAAVGIYLQHGHEYETAHNFDPKDSIVTTEEGERYFIPSWGAYFVTNVVNRFKEERVYINSIRPVKNFLIHGLIFDTFFTIRFMVAIFYYFFMVRFVYFFKVRKSFKLLFQKLITELELFKDYEHLTQKFFTDHPDAKVLIVGHTHEPMIHEYIDNTYFINTGTWTKMLNLDLKNNGNQNLLTFASISLYGENYSLDEFEDNTEFSLLEWRGNISAPYIIFN